MQQDDLEYVGFWARVLATLIDSLLLLCVTAPLLISIYGMSFYTRQDKPFIAGPADFLINWVLPAIAVIVFWVYKGATPGKMAIGAQVVDSRTGKAVSVGQAIGRYLAYFISLIPFCLGVIWVGFDSRKQGWHDKLAGTVVVRKKSRSASPVAFES